MRVCGRASAAFALPPTRFERRRQIGGTVEHAHYADATDSDEFPLMKRRWPVSWKRKQPAFRAGAVGTTSGQFRRAKYGDDGRGPTPATLYTAAGTVAAKR
jgi:hypothetical protein